VKIGTIGIESELLQALLQSDLEVVAIANTQSTHENEGSDYGFDLDVSASQLHLVRNPIVDGVVLSVDSSDRFFLVHEALKAGKHVLVDSQLAHNLGQAAFLESFARSQECLLLTGHPALHSEAVRHARSLLRANAGALRILTSRRHWSGSDGHGLNELWDRIACDVALFDALTDVQPSWVSTVATSPDAGAALDSLHLTLHYETPRGSVFAQIELCEAERGEPDRVSANADGLRLELLERSPYQIDLLVNENPQVPSRTDPRVETYRHFVACVNSNNETVAEDLGLSVARTLDAARRSLHSSGRAAIV